MNDEKVCEIFYREYRARVSENQNLFQRANFLVVVIALLTGGLSAVTRLDLSELFWTRFDVFLFYIFGAVAALSAVLACFFLFACLRPRVTERLSSLKNWDSWRNDYQKLLLESGEDEGDGVSKVETVEEVVGSEFSKAFAMRLAQAADFEGELLRLKHKWFARGFLATSSLLCFLVLHSLMGLELALLGIQS